MYINDSSISKDMKKEDLVKNQITLGNLCVSSSDAKIEKLLEVVDKLLTKHKDIVKESKVPEETPTFRIPDEMFG